MEPNMPVFSTCHVLSPTELYFLFFIFFPLYFLSFFQQTIRAGIWLGHKSKHIACQFQFVPNKK
jgi:hypothetical protein